MSNQAKTCPVRGEFNPKSDMLYRILFKLDGYYWAYKVHLIVSNQMPDWNLATIFVNKTAMFYGP